MRDPILASLALAAFALFVGVLAYNVPELDLTIVIAIGVLAAAIDFARELWRKGSR